MTNLGTNGSSAFFDNMPLGCNLDELIGEGQQYDEEMEFNELIKDIGKLEVIDNSGIILSINGKNIQVDVGGGVLKVFIG